MKRLAFLLIFIASAASAQTFTTTDSTTVQSVVNPRGKVSNLDQFNTPIIKNGLVLDPGFEKPMAAVLTQVGSSNLGFSNYFVDANSFAIVPANEAVGVSPDLGVAQIWRPGSGDPICTAPINGNNAGDSNGSRWQAVMSGGTTGNVSAILPTSIVASVNSGVVSLTIFNNQAPGIADGTYSLTFNGGSPTTSAVGTYTVASNVITSTNLSNAGAGYSSAPQVVLSTPPSTIIVNGIDNRTVNLQVHGGGGTGAAATMSCRGATLGAGGYTGATCTPTVGATGSGYSSIATINIWNGYVLGSCTSGSAPSGGFSVGDYVGLRWGYGPTTQAQFTAAGWGFSGAGSASGSTDVPSGDLPPGSQNGQSIQLVGPITVGQEFDTGSPAGQNLYQMVDPIATSVSIKGVSGSGPIGWTIQRLTQAGATGGFSCSGSITETNGSWVAFSNYASSCTTGETIGSGTGAVGPVNVTFTVPSGTTILLDNPYVAAASSGNASIYQDTFVAATAAEGGSDRNLDNQMPGTRADLLQVDTRSVHPYTFGDNCNNGSPLWSAGCIKAPFIPTAAHINMCEQLSIDCWDVIGVGLTQADATYMADFFGGTVTNGYPTCTGGMAGAIARCLQNHTTPYTTSFASKSRTFRLELGNENWNTASAGAKWLAVPTCTAGANCGSTYASGVDTQYPYGNYVQNFAGAFEADANYNSAVERIVFGAQMSGSNTTFGLDNLFKATSTPGTPHITATVDIAYAPYIDFIPTATGFDQGTPVTNQQLSDYANAYWNMDNANGLINIPVSAYSNPTVGYESGGGQTSKGFTTNLVQAMENGYQNGVGAGLAQVMTSLEGCKTLGFGCQSYHFFVTQQQNNTFTPSTQVTFTGTTTNGSNVITGVTVTSDMYPGQSVSAPGFGSSADANGTAGIWSIGTNSVTLNKNANCSTTCGSNTLTIKTLAVNLWGGYIGLSAQSNNRIRVPLLFMQEINKAMPYGSRETQTVGSSIPTFTFPATGTCGSGSTAGNAGPCNQAFGQNPTPTSVSGIPLLYGYSYANGTFRSHAYLNLDSSAHTITIAGSPLAGLSVTQRLLGSGNAVTDTNDGATALVSPAVSTVTMPTSLTLQPNSMAVFFGNTGATTPASLTLGNTMAPGVTLK